MLKLIFHTIFRATLFFMLYIRGILKLKTQTHSYRENTISISSSNFSNLK